jgi:hypothetical protein
MIPFNVLRKWITLIRFLYFSGMSENPKSMANLRDGGALMP